MDDTYIALWQAVIMQLITDGLGNKESKDRTDAIKYIKTSVEFDRVCDMANFDPNFVRNNFIRTLEKKQEKEELLMCP